MNAEIAKKAREHAENMEAYHSKSIMASVACSKYYKAVGGTVNQYFSTYVRTVGAEIMVVPFDSVEAAIKFGLGNTCILNFASYKNPGGRFLDGSMAQEEALCHESTLYNVLCRFEKSYYAENRKLSIMGCIFIERYIHHQYCLYTTV